MTSRLVSLAAVSVLALGMVGCGQSGTPAAPAPAPSQPASQSAPAEQSPTDQAPASPTQPSGDQSSQAPGGGQAPAEERNAAALRAIATAEQSENAKAFEIDDEDDDNSWEVDVLAGDRVIEVEVSADGNEVISREDDDDDDDDDDRALVDRAQITLTEAIEAALAEAPGTLDDAELDDEDDQDIWEISIDQPEDDDVEVHVSTQDGSIVEVDR